MRNQSQNVMRKVIRIQQLYGELTVVDDQELGKF